MVAAGIVLYALTALAICWFGWRIHQRADDLAVQIHDTMETEVRRHDERLEKRAQRARGQNGDVDETEPGQPSAVQSGRPMRR